jgi:hypothetical protein
MFLGCFSIERHGQWQSKSVYVLCADKKHDLPRALWVRLPVYIFGFPFGRDCLHYPGYDVPEYGG